MPGGAGNDASALLTLPEHAGLPVLSIEPDFASAPVLSAWVMRHVVGTAEAPVYVKFRHETRMGINHTYVLGREDAYRLVRFFCYARGKGETFWVPTWQMDLLPLGDLVTGGTTLDVAQVDWNSTYGAATSGNAFGRHVWFLHEDGTFWTNEIEGSSGVDPETIELSTPAAMTWEQGRFILGFMMRARFASDEMEIEWLSEQVARCRLAFVESWDE